MARRQVCEFCKVRPATSQERGSISITACQPCEDFAGHENNHQDGHPGAPESECWVCNPELDESAADYTPRKGHHSPRRPQINHKACQHAQTPAARRECRKAYWAGQAVIQQENLEAMAAAHAPALHAQYSGLVSWDGAKGRVLTGTIVKDLGAGKLQVRTAKGALRQVAFTALRLAS